MKNGYPANLDKEIEWIEPPKSQVGFVPLYKVTPGKIHSVVVCSHLPISRLTHYFEKRSRLCLSPFGGSCALCGNRNTSKRWVSYFVGIDPSRSTRGKRPFALYSLTSGAYNRLPEWARDRQTSWKGRCLTLRRNGASDKSALVAEFDPAKAMLLEEMQEYENCSTNMFLNFCINRVLADSEYLLTGMDE